MPLSVLRQLRPVPARFLKQLAADAALFRELLMEVRGWDPHPIFPHLAAELRRPYLVYIRIYNSVCGVNTEPIQAPPTHLGTATTWKNVWTRAFTS